GSANVWLCVEWYRRPAPDFRPPTSDRIAVALHDLGRLHLDRVHVLRALHLDDFAAGKALPEQALQRVDGIQGRDQDVLSLGCAVVREPGCRNGLSDAAFPTGEGVT